MRRFLVIINPVSGRGKGAAVAPLAERVLVTGGNRTRVRLSTGPGHARSLACGADSEWADAVIAVGGDGTINEVVNGIADRPLPLGIVPLGTGNVAAKEMGIPRGDVAAALRVALGGRTRRIDLGEATPGGRFVCMVSAGFDAAVVKLLTFERKGAMKMVDYFPLVWKALTGTGRAGIRAIADGEVVGDGLVYANCANGASYGGPVQIVNQACPDDGKLDALTLHANVSVMFVPLAALALTHQFHRFPGVRVRRCTHLRLEPESGAPAPFQMDGEYRGELPVDIRILPGALTVYVP